MLTKFLLYTVEFLYKCGPFFKDTFPAPSPTNTYKCLRRLNIATFPDHD